MKAVKGRYKTLDMQTLESLIERVIEGEQAWFEQIVKHYQKSLYKYIRYLTNSCNDVEDIMQDVFLKVYDNLDKYQLGTSFNRWIYKITYNHTMNELKKRNRRKVFLCDNLPDLPDARVEDTGISSKTKKVLSLLTLEERNLLYLRIYEEMSYKKMSEVLSKSEVSLRKKYERARKKFIKLYEMEGNVDETREVKVTDIRVY
ncbi:MAG: sigma-70 family RNA polymerase sigma factor [Clostridiales bacterium]|nr:sigma-70 family RNA polymerase sigma factor [Clostridiales bacterium]